EAGWDSGSPAAIAPPAPPPASIPEHSFTPSRYGPARRMNPAAVAVTAAVHVVFGLALLGLGVQTADKTRQRMAVVELSSTPPAASQPPPQPQPEDQSQPITLPPPVITLPRPQAAILPVALEPPPPPAEVARVAVSLALPVPPAPAAPPAPPLPALV